MKLRIAKTLLLIAIVLPLSSCPTASIDLGLWYFWIKLDGELGVFYSIILLPGGETEPAGPPYENTDPLEGTVTWSQFGSRLTITQEVDSSTTYRLRGDIEETNKVSGDTLSQIGGGATGQWFANTFTFTSP